MLIYDKMLKNNIFVPPCGYGGIGRRARLRI